MSGTDTDGERTTRRRTIAAVGAAITGAAAGCTGQQSSTAETTTTATHSVQLSPAGRVEFDAVPETVFTAFPQYADMAVALGHGDAVNAVYVPEMSGTTMNHYYRRLDGISFEWEGLQDPLTDGLVKEQLYSLGSDVHLADPAWASAQTGWDRSDVDEIASQVGPWVGNFYSGTRATPPEGYDGYEYYPLWDLFGKVAAVFREQARYEALASVHADLLSTIQSNLPPESERPTAVRATLADDGQSFYTYHLNAPGYWLADTRPLGAVDAFGDGEWDGLWGTVDYETMLEADPDVFLHLWGLTPNYDMASVRDSLATHEVGSQLTAVQNDHVYPGGMRYQGPLMNLFQLEMGAKQLYPEQFGEWPEYEDGTPYPEIPEDEWLFDRRRVASIVGGDV